MHVGAGRVAGHGIHEVTSPAVPAHPRIQVAARTVPRKPIPGVRRLGRFRLIEPLGEGCQAQVWKAIQVEPVVETLALKLLSPRLADDPKRLAQFHREAEVGAQLDDPALLPTYEFGEVDGHFFMTMPLVNGESLAEVVAQTRARSTGRVAVPRNWWNWLSEDAYTRAMVRIVARIARALAVAHANQVVHRDIKPANILIDRDREDRVYLCDFGLSRDLDSPRGPACFGTGTPLYMAPEKLMACAEDDIRCDVYALGVTLFEAVTRSHPFTIPVEVPRSDWAAYLAISAPRSPRAASPWLDPALERVIQRAMERDPNRRYASATELAEALERLDLNRASA
jgi:serine/threonine-protein kinase